MLSKKEEESRRVEVVGVSKYCTDIGLLRGDGTLCVIGLIKVYFTLDRDMIPALHAITPERHLILEESLLVSFRCI